MTLRNVDRPSANTYLRASRSPGTSRNHGSNPSPWQGAPRPPGTTSRSSSSPSGRSGKPLTHRIVSSISSNPSTWMWLHHPQT
eukprot:3217058-Amphidinium_carterae.1